MTSSLTIRLSEEQRRALQRRATSMNRNESSWVRELILRDIGNLTMAEKVGELVGSINSRAHSPSVRHPMAAQLHERNWRR